jgi:hypothetical protein
MTTDQAIKHYGSRALLAEELGIAAPSTYDWGDYPPPLRQLQLQALTGGKLLAESDVYTVQTKRAKASA